MKAIFLTFCLMLFYSLGYSSCDIKSAQDVLDCSIRRHPDVLRAEAEVRAADALKPAALQRPNPEIGSDVTTFSSNEEPTTKVEAAYLHTFELGGKRRIRSHQAERQRIVVETVLKRTKEEVAKETVSKLYRLRQIAEEIRLVDEAAEVFSRIIQFYQARPRRSAEQDVSLDVFSMAKADYQLRRTNLLQEKAALSGFFTVVLGIPMGTLEKVLPAPKSEWPAIAATSAGHSVVREEAVSRQSLSKGDLEIAKSDVWPDLRLGPRVELQSGHGKDAQGYGAAFSLGLPLYHRNQGLRAQAQAEVDRAQVALDQTDRELTALRARQLVVYQEAVDAYQNSPAIDDVETRHEAMERQFTRGLLPASLVIEAHRQRADYSRSRHEMELRAIEALWDLYALDGHALEKRL
jgi:outer membrane protein, heavy metal efflux system